MYRDFSEKSRNELLKLVSEVENEKVSDFTDWVGDRWYDFESWIGKLNIKNYLNNINAYHKKVIDKNNATKSSINSIFSKVKALDSLYKRYLSNEKLELEQLANYIDDMSLIITPKNKRHNIKYLSKSLKKIMSILRNDSIENTESGSSIFWNSEEDVKNYLKLLIGSPQSTSDRSTMNTLFMKKMASIIYKDQFGDLLNIDASNIKKLSKLTKTIGKIGKGNDKISLASTIFGYFGSLADVANAQKCSTDEVVSKIFSLTNSSAKVETGFYDYFLKTLHPYEAAKLHGKFNKTMTGINILEGIAGFGKSVVETYKVFSDPESSGYDKTAQTLKTGNSFLGLGRDVYIAAQSSQKTLHFVNKVEGSKKAVNQILVTEQKLKFGHTPDVAKKTKKTKGVFTLIMTGISTLSGGIKRAGEVTEDGKFDLNDASSVGSYASLSGLDTLVSSVTFSIIDVDSESIAKNTELDIQEFAKGDSWAAKYIRDKENCGVSRFLVSVGTGAYIVGENVVDDISGSFELEAKEFLARDNWATRYIRNEENDYASRLLVSVGSGAYIIGENVVEGVVDSAKTIGSWISYGWDKVTNLF